GGMDGVADGMCEGSMTSTNGAVGVSSDCAESE
ncbi:hypothetical protein L195_g062659, partial [Trifolium pratense]